MVSERRNTSVRGQYEVAVCGGGVAGIAAALAAARRGKKTLLLEKTFLLGGLATAGLVTIYLPLCDGYGHQVSCGIAEELLRLSVKYGAEEACPAHWMEKSGACTEQNARFQVRFNAQVFALLAEQLLLEAGVEILYGTYVVDVEMVSGRIACLITENKSGREAYRVKSVVDATGDGDIAAFAKAPTDVFRQGNVLAAWYYATGKSPYGLRILGCADIPDEQKNDENEVALLDKRRFSGLDGRENSEMMMLAHRVIRNDFLQCRKEDPTCWPATLPTIPQIRMSRKLRGEYVLSDKEVHCRFEDSVGLVSDWRKRGPVYEVPFGTLYSRTVKNLLVAGRCTSVTEAMWDIMRVIPCCAVTGQAAGTAAAMTDDLPSLDVKALQQVLRGENVPLHITDVIK